MSLWNLCCDSEGALIRWPLFSDREPSELPWDAARVCDNRRWRNAISVRLSMERDYPEPTPRTRASTSGYDAWTKWLDAEKRVAHEPGYEKPHERHPLIVPEMTLMFDYKVYKRYNELCYYHHKRMRAYRESELNVVGEEKAKRRQKQELLASDAVFG